MKTQFNRLQKLFSCALLIVLASGCAQNMCINEPKPFTPASTVVGARRIAIIGELGQPLVTEPHGTNLVDTYKYVDGGAKNSGESKTARVVLYTAGDIFTCFFDQIIWIPSEKYGFAGTDHVVIVDYAKSDDDLWHATKIDNQELTGRSTKKESP
jgi:hypothetical protein